MKAGLSWYTVLLTLFVAGSFTGDVNGFSGTKNVSLKQTSINKILKEIKYFQDLYFKIVKSNDVLLSDYVEDVHVKDSEKLKSLFDKGIGKINKDNVWLKKYEDILKKLSSVENELTTYDMTVSEGKSYEAVDKFLNDIYIYLKTKLSPAAFKELQKSQRAWLKEVLAYKKVFDSKQLGTMASFKKISYEKDMRSFRIYLLILFEQQYLGKGKVASK